MMGSLVTDTAMAYSVKQIIVKFSRLSDTAAVITGDLSKIVSSLKSGKGTMGVLLTDTSVVYNLNKTIKSIDTGAVNFNQNMEALKHTWPLKKYFKRKK
jgi:phospholipid/cholesterol/gamma-HCH transport system substrate-binding protein